MRAETAVNDAAELSGGLPHTNVRDIPGPHSIRRLVAAVNRVNISADNDIK